MKAKVFNILTMLILAVAGLLFLLYPDKSIQILVPLLGVGLILMGLAMVISYLLKKEKDQNDLISCIIGAVLVIFGILDILLQKTVAGIFPLVAAALVVLGGVAGILQAIRDKKKGANWKYLMAVAMASLVLGFIMLLRSFDEDTILRVLGTALLYLGSVGLAKQLDHHE